MNKFSIFSILTFIIFFSFPVFAVVDPNGQPSREVIILGSTHKPHHLIDIAEPVAMYTVSTSTLDFTFDAAYYSEYTIHLVGEYVEMDYFVYTPVVYIPVATFGDIVDIYIESEDCGCYFGTLDRSK